jgi:hypothetical protein
MAGLLKALGGATDAGVTSVTAASMLDLASS